MLHLLSRPERGERMPVAFFDNPLVVPFSQKRGQGRLVSATLELASLSRECEVPVVGYVDRSFSRDLMSMLELLMDDGAAREGLVDAELLRGREGAERGRRRSPRAGAVASPIAGDGGQKMWKASRIGGTGIPDAA